eukprot:6212221-Pleurochrysis_carterae.AAC.5
MDAALHNFPGCASLALYGASGSSIGYARAQRARAYRVYCALTAAHCFRMQCFECCTAHAASGCCATLLSSLRATCPCITRHVRHSGTLRPCPAHCFCVQ